MSQLRTSPPLLADSTLDRSARPRQPGNRLKPPPGTVLERSVVFADQAPDQSVLLDKEMP
jgi:hypothetical protein